MKLREVHSLLTLLGSQAAATPAAASENLKSSDSA
jgi:hypothetical protein